MEYGLVSIIMLSHNNGDFLEESVRSIMMQTYPNWELLFVDDSSKDNSVHKILEIFGDDDRIHVSYTVFENGPALHLNSALKAAQGEWIAFINCGDCWEPEKLERQVSFMINKGASFTYTKFRLKDENGKDAGVIVGGIKSVTYKDLMKCCWLCFPTVMYNAKTIGVMQVKNLWECNDYALWLKVSRKVDCLLLDECLSTQLTNRHLYSPFPIKNKIKWRYEVYHTEMDYNPIVSALMTIRSLSYGIWKKMNYSIKDIK